jgi:sarcosine oxidase
VPDSFAAVWEPGAGVLAPERCIAAMLREARRESAEIVVDTPVTGWRAERDHVVVATAARDYRVGRILLTAGPWMPEIVPDLPLPLTRERVVQCWFDPAVAPHRFAAGSFPVFLIEDEARRLFYGLPDTGRGVKAAFHHGGEPTTMADVRRRVTHEESAAVREALGRWVPDAAGPLREATVCLYTNTPDGHFLLDRHPRTPRAVIASCCSGHGFKFAPAIGEMLADLATGAPPRFDPAPFGLGRFPAFRA